MKHLTILIPCHNEAKGLPHVIQSIPKHQLVALGIETDIIVVDNGSTDETAQVASGLGVMVVSETRIGKGWAMRKGFGAVSPKSDYVVMLDGDNTYKGNEIVRMVEPLVNDFCDVVVGSRLSGKLSKNSLARKNRIANWFFTFLVRSIYLANITDVLSGYFAWNREAMESVRPHISTDGFAIEMEIVTKLVKMGYSVYSVPITYDERMGRSKLRAVRDGAEIMAVLLRNLTWSPKKHYTKHHRKPPVGSPISPLSLEPVS